MLNRLAVGLLAGFVACGCTDSSKPQSNDAAPRAMEPIGKYPATGVTADVPEFRGVREVIVAGEFTADVMNLAYPRRALDLVQRMQEAMSKNRLWAIEHAKKAKPGEPLPYDSRLGLTEPEYKEFQTLLDAMTVQKTGEATITVAAKSEGVYVLDSGQALEGFSDIEIDLNKDQVRTPFCILKKSSELKVSANSAIGAWDGIEWKYEKVGASGVIGLTASFSVGKLKPSGRSVIYYKVIVGALLPGDDLRHPVTSE